MLSGGRKMKASIFYRIAAILLLLLAIGHTLGFRQSDPQWGVDALLSSMRSIHFDVQGFNRTYWDLFLAAGQPPGGDSGNNARHGMGIRSLLCRHHRGSVAIPLSAAYRFHASDYVV